jgi:hypothetical protein
MRKRAKDNCSGNERRNRIKPAPSGHLAGAPVKRFSYGHRAGHGLPSKMGMRMSPPLVVEYDAWLAGRLWINSNRLWRQATKWLSARFSFAPIELEREFVQNAVQAFR